MVLGKPAEAPAARILELHDVAKTYRTLGGASIVALSPTSIAFGAGEFVGVVGPSGCGKTTLLNLAAGLLRPSAGSIRFRGRTVDGPSADISMVFQRPVLLPWRKVIDNVLLPAEVLRLEPARAYRAKAENLLAILGLEGFGGTYPRELSGGMQQRVAIARALIYDSSVLLMDEPFAALDAMTREELNLELLRIWKMTGRTILFVTHNIPEAVLLSDRVVVMTPRPGKLSAVVPVTLGRPRSLALLGDPEFGRIVGRIRGLLETRAAPAA
jgi:NitT/TauT family transport system ATP-binding protein